MMIFLTLYFETPVLRDNQNQKIRNSSPQMSVIGYKNDNSGLLVT